MLESITPFYFLRHGQTAANEQGLMCGGLWDLPLSADGIAQANDVARRLAKVESFRPTRIYSSPLTRARETAEIVGQALRLPIVSLPDLREWEIGVWDRMPFEKVKHEFLGEADPQEGESRVVFRARVLSVLSHVTGRNGYPLLVSHGAVGLFLQKILQPENPSDRRLRLENCVPYHFFREEGAAWVMRPVL